MRTDRSWRRLVFVRRVIRGLGGESIERSLVNPAMVSAVQPDGKRCRLIWMDAQSIWDIDESIDSFYHRCWPGEETP